jgi:pilus assembly protein Flp/PilA
MRRTSRQGGVPTGEKSAIIERPLGLAAASFGFSYSARFLAKGERMLTTINSMIRDEDGATMVEYGLLIGLIAIVAMVGVKTLGSNLQTLYTTIAGSI